MKKILKKFSAENNEEKQKKETIKQENKALNAGFCVKYCGSACIGTEGDVKQIERAILLILKSEEVKSIPAKFECLEIGIRVTQDTDDKVCKHNS